MPQDIKFIGAVGDYYYFVSSPKPTKKIMEYL